MTRPSTVRRVMFSIVAGAATLVGAAAWGALKAGDPAPTFSADAALGGQVFHFDLAQALKKGPVVLYFYPKAFTSGCTVEAHQFAEATPKLQALGATLIGMSNDDIDTLKRFSVEACRSQFAVAADPGARTARQYRATMAVLPGMADRITYVIGTDGRIAGVHASLSPDGHVEYALKTVQALKR